MRRLLAFVAATCFAGLAMAAPFADMTPDMEYVSPEEMAVAIAAAATNQAASAAAVAVAATNHTDAVGAAVAQAATNHTDAVVASATNGLLRTESDPTVPAWAKSADKPAYSAEDVGALPIDGGTMTGTLYVGDAASLSYYASDHPNGLPVAEEYDANQVYIRVARRDDGSTVAFREDIAPRFSSSESYAVGQLVVIGGELMKCIAAGVGDAATFAYANVEDALAALRAAVAAGTALAGGVAVAATNYTVAVVGGATNGLLRTESDPSVPPWAKTAQKPSYTYTEIIGTPDLSGYLVGDAGVLTNNAAFTVAVAAVSPPADLDGLATNVALPALSGNATVGDVVARINQLLEALHE